MRIKAATGFLILALISGISMNSDGEIPNSKSPMTNEQYQQISIPGKGANLKSELIYELDAKPTASCHASTIVEVDDGLVAAWFGGTHEKHSDVGIWVSMNLNGEWSKPVEVVNGFQNDTLRYPTWNPVLFNPKGGPLMLFYKVGPSPREWWGMLTTSDNGGRTWSEPVKLGENKKTGHLLGPVKNKPVQLEDGTIICPSSTETRNESENLWRVHFEITKDLGKTWRVIGPINDGLEFDAIQPSILFHKGGKMQILCRTREGVVSQSWSDDGGETWSKMTATELPNPNAGTDAVTLKDGRHLLVYNPIGRTTGRSRRSALNVAVSEDGIHWKVALVLENDNIVQKDKNLNLDAVGLIHTNSEYSYPAIIQSKDGLVHITYTYQRKSVKYVVIDPDEIGN